MEPIRVHVVDLYHNDSASARGSLHLPMWCECVICGQNLVLRTYPSELSLDRAQFMPEVQSIVYRQLLQKTYATR